MAQRPGSWTPGQHGRAPINEYIEPGDSPRKLHMRGNLPTEDYALAIARCVKRYTRTFNFAGLDLIMDIESLLPAVRGQRMMEVTDMLTGRDADHKNPKGIQQLAGGQVEPYRDNSADNR